LSLKPSSISSIAIARSFGIYSTSASAHLARTNFNASFRVISFMLIMENDLFFTVTRHIFFTRHQISEIKKPPEGG
jgi:hypothetical protein